MAESNPNPNPNPSPNPSPIPNPNLGGKAWRWRGVREELQKWHALLACNGTLSELLRGWPADQALLTSRQELRVLLIEL